MVGLSQDGDHLPLHEFAAVGARRAVEALEVHRAEAVAVPHEEAAQSQITAAHWGKGRHLKKSAAGHCIV